ncbi:predicted AlkP superfamily pyrophosphatase or phosphodiesterase [Bacillus oleivorans]|uniref:Predicted AlkP superfamily pyrophosphatase or phosphodiesterase n=1 Tax=Bacillus oleivorans TaxID=1448271 RepID=A0A285CYX0_9BACI|nr:alkaline phosphatase family protein [Bacillus oleivorans]SNX72752.1 predicted AlkP superfamily pyrophosphatase or phosphodiesterase [Bacillus oleivorans]
MNPNLPFKPVILLMIDTLMPNPLEVAVQTGHAPALQFLMEKGIYISNMVSSFPTMSVTIDSSLLTGTYPDKHHIPGLNWFDVSNNEIINYGTGFRETFRLGADRFISNMLYRLNNNDLSGDVTTIYEDLAQKGIPSASINAFVYRGNTPQRLHFPRMLSSLTHGDREWTTAATPIFSLGSLSKLRPWGFVPQIFVGNYKFSARELRHLIRKNELPGFTLCTFQDLDLRVHFKGPMDIKGIAQMDREVQKILNLYPSWEEALIRNVWLVMGDNGHAPMGSRYNDFIIDLRKIFKKFRIARLQRSVCEKDQLVLCVNQRMAYIYVLDKNLPLSVIIERLKHDHRIDIIAWKNGSYIYVESGMREGLLHYGPGGEYTDEYNQLWSIKGNPELMDLRLTNDKRVTYGDYPDALARVYGALHSHPGRFIVVNAKPGCEFKAQSTPFHLGGSAHGSLHKQESLVPLVIAGTAVTPNYPRIVDLKEFVLRLILQQFMD